MLGAGMEKAQKAWCAERKTRAATEPAAEAPLPALPTTSGGDSGLGPEFPGSC